MKSEGRNLGGVRLQKVLAAAGVGSRRACEGLIAAGRVSVDGAVVAEMGVKVDPARQDIRVDGRKIGAAEAKRTFLADKPRGVICTSRDPQGRPTVLEWAHGEGLPPGRFFGVGRLDGDSEGLLLLTTDGELAQRLAHPSRHVEKEYRVWCDRAPGETEEAAWLAGVEDGGETLRALRVVREAGRSARLVLGEGRNRQVRRMCEAVGLRVRRLRRVRIGRLSEAALKGRRLVELERPLEAVTGAARAERL